MRRYILDFIHERGTATPTPIVRIDPSFAFAFAEKISTQSAKNTPAPAVRHNDVAVTLIYERRFEMEMIHIVDKTTQIANIVRYLRVLNRLSYEHFERIVLYSAIHMQNSYKARVQRSLTNSVDMEISFSVSLGNDETFSQY